MRGHHDYSPGEEDEALTGRSQHRRRVGGRLGNRCQRRLERENPSLIGNSYRGKSTGSNCGGKKGEKINEGWSSFSRSRGLYHVTAISRAEKRGGGGDGGDLSEAVKEGEKRGPLSTRFCSSTSGGREVVLPSSLSHSQFIDGGKKVLPHKTEKAMMKCGQ